MRAANAVGPGDAIIAVSKQESVPVHSFDGVWVLNEGAARASAMGLEERRRLWKRAGLSVDGGTVTPARVYAVSIENLKPSRVERIGRALPPKLGADGWPEEAAVRRAARAAVRALYALGLDIGEAEVALSDAGRAIVLDARPRVSAAAAGSFAAWYAAAAEGGGRRPILIGADPEFALLTPAGKLAPASRFFGEGAAGAAGADAMVVGRRVIYPVAELRPAPAETPAALAANVRRLLARAAASIGDPSLRWVAGAMPLPGLALGGHIHISGAPLTGRLLRMLDSCAAYPLALVEDPAGRGRRPRYGALGDYRPQPHGGFEYRTLPSWLVSPAAAKAAFAIALLCAREALRIPRLPAREERFAEAYYAGDRAELAGCLDGVYSAIAATESYPALSRYIEPLFDAARRGKTWDESVDIRGKWRMRL
ncbi:putative amidoligase domain-containing protein [Paenibacillus soyae]|uniref:PhiEco32-like amidoligase-type 2 protein n=1 Tax=Paenibacillus soyae TaxID=2969249 RepID=A0A9X2MND9_9BACL|nr:hypothetical protein [Paenibacillus soyae]